MRFNNIVDDKDANAASLNDSGCGEDTDEDENWLLPEEGQQTDSKHEGNEGEVCAQAIAIPTLRNVWTRRMFRSKRMLPTNLNEPEEIKFCLFL